MIARAGSVIRCIQAMVAPDRFNTPSQGTETRVDILKDIPIQQNFSVIAPTLGELVPSNRGMILWLIDRGLYSMYRMHFVPAGTVSTASLSSIYNFTTPTLAYRTILASPSASNLTTVGLLSNLTYVWELALPVLQVAGTNEVITIDQNIPNELSFTRLYAGQLSLDSSSVSVGNTSLNGAFSAASISDTREIAQTSNGAFQVNQIAASSETQEDYVYQVPVNQGVTAIIGPDVSNEFQMPQQDQVVLANGIYTPIRLTQLNAFQTGAGFSIAATNGDYQNPGTYSQYFFYSLGNAWVSPWNITPTIVANAIGSNIQGPTQTVTPITQPTLNPTSETGCYRFRVSAQFAFGYNVNTDDVTIVECGVIATHIFAGVNLQGNILYTSYKERKPYLCGNLNLNAAATVTSFDFDPTFFRQGFTTDGKYIGTFFSFYVNAVVSAYYTYTTTLNSLQNYLYSTITLQPPTIYICTSDVNVRGEVGPARILRWDGLAPNNAGTGTQGMVLNLSSKIWCQGIPNAQLTPYVKDKIQARMRMVPMDVVDLAMRLFNNPNNPLNRVWNKKEYEAFVRDIVMNLNEEKIIEWANSSGIGAEMEAEDGGLYRAIKAKVGSIERSGLAGTMGLLGQNDSAVGRRPRGSYVGGALGFY